MNTFYLLYVIIMLLLLHTKLKYTPIMPLNIIHTVQKKISLLKSAGNLWRYESHLEFRKETALLWCDLLITVSCALLYYCVCAMITWLFTRMEDFDNVISHKSNTFREEKLCSIVIDNKSLIRSNLHMCKQLLYFE
jgi:hypothetical protein